jgi:DNA-binding Xre family transcriptional regulator
MRAMKYNMIQSRLASLLKARKKSVWWLHQQTSIGYPTLLKLRDSKTQAISFNTLESICRTLQCTPNDLLVIVESPKT